MEYQLRHESCDITAPVYDFPGDEVVSAEAYRDCIQSGYISSVSTISGAAERFGLSVDAETFERWKRVGSCAGLVDDFLDESPDRELAHALYIEGLLEGPGAIEQKAPAWADNRLSPAITLLKNSVANLPPQQLSLLRNAAANIGYINQRKAICEDVEAYTKLLRQEAGHTATLVTGTASTYMRGNPRYLDFANWVRSALELGTLIDSSRDIWRDHQEQRTGVSPTAINCGRIALAAHVSFRSMIASENRSATLSSLRSRRGFYKRL